MTTYQLFPNLTADEFDALSADIRERGVMVPVELDEAGAILDGHHRAMIADSLGIEYPTIVREGWTEDQKLVHVVALNAHRRHLTAVERADVVGTLRQAKLSTRAIAKAVGVSVGTIHSDLHRSELNAAPERIDTTDGRSYPARRTTPAFRRATPREELAARATRWAGIALRLREVMTFPPDEYVPLLTSDERHAWEANVADTRAWLDRVDAALRASSGLRIVNGGTT